MLIKEVVSAILDLSKTAASDDSWITEELVLFLCKKYRSFLLQKEIERKGGSPSALSEFEYQQIGFDLETIKAIDGLPCTGGYYVRTKNKVPKTIEGTEPIVHLVDYFQGINLCYIPKERMRYLGSNPYLKNIIYVAMGPDFHLYLGSTNPQFKYLKKLRMNGVFEDFDELSDYLCDEEGESCPCNVMDAEFPMRDNLLPALIDLVVKEITSAAYRPSDKVNDSDDDLSDIIAWARRNMKSGFQKQIEG